MIAREDIKARMIEEAALAVDDKLVSALDRFARRELCARVRQATATVVWRYFKSRYSPDLTGGYLASPAAGAMHSMIAS